MKKVLIATPCLDGKVDAWFVNSLYESTKLGLQNDVMFQPVFLANESILPMARNELLNLAYQQGYDDLVFITWSKFVKDDGVILFHDTCVPHYDVRQFFDEIPLPKINFTCSHGLGVVSKNSSLIEEIQETFQLDK